MHDFVLFLMRSMITNIRYHSLERKGFVMELLGILVFGSALQTSTLNRHYLAQLYRPTYS